MLRLDPKLRPNASMLLQNADVLIKLSLDETSTSFSLQQQQQHENNHHNNQQQQQPSVLLINTIKVPHNLNKLNQALPKPCYSDVRPNSPSSWIISDQKEQYLKNEKAVLHHQQYIQQQRKASLSALPIVPPLPLPVTSTDSNHQQQQQQQYQNGKENHQPIPPPTTRSQISDHSSARSNNNNNPPLHHHGKVLQSTNVSSLPTPPSQPPVPPLPIPTAGLSAVDEYFYRRNHALAPVVITKNNNNNNTDNNSIDSNNNDYKNKGHHNNHHYHKPPSIPTHQSNNHEPVIISTPSTDIPPTIPISHYDSNGHYIHRPKQPQPPTRPAANAVASRLQYHHRVW
jgi:hypothetical protein